MRLVKQRIVVNHARDRRAGKRGGDAGPAISDLAAATLPSELAEHGS